MRQIAIFVWVAAVAVSLVGTTAEAKRREHCDIHISTLWDARAGEARTGEKKTVDVDTLVKAEGEDSVISFWNKEGERTVMVRDEMGLPSTDRLKHQPSLYELVIVRDAVPGDYAVNVRVYYGEGIYPFTASVVIDRAMHSMGSVSRLAHVNVEISEKKTQYTAIQFHLESDCTLSGVNRNPIHMEEGDTHIYFREENQQKDDTLWVK